MAQGFEAAFDLLDRLPSELRERLKLLLGTLGKDIAEEQKAAVPVDTGTLKSGIGSEVLDDPLTLRAGVLGFKFGRNKYFYGLWVELGRQAGVKAVRRLKRGARPEFLRRIRAGEARRSRRPADLLVEYDLPIKATPARPFINVPGRDLSAAARIADYWAEVFPA